MNVKDRCKEHVGQWNAAFIVTFGVVVLQGDAFPTQLQMANLEKHCKINEQTT